MIHECYSIGRTLPEAYHDALVKLYRYGIVCDCKAWNTEQIEVGMTMAVQFPLQEPMISKLFPGGTSDLEQYRQEMLDGILDFEVDAGKWDYTYHSRMVAYQCGSNDFCNQLEFVVNELRKDPSSRRAVMDIRSNYQDLESDDPSCLQHIQLTIRDGKLNMFVLFRSNDAVKATFMNAFALIMLQKRIADELGVDVGGYIHRANSFHCYQRDYKTLEAYVNAIENNSVFNLSYPYEGGWKELMEEDKDAIAKKVAVLKERSFHV